MTIRSSVKLGTKYSSLIITNLWISNALLVVIMGINWNIVLYCIIVLEKNK